ncbi:MAG: glyoxalase, partial [SAR86 cluster bacterium]
KNNVGLHHLALSIASFEELDALYEVLANTDGVVIEFSPEPLSGGPTKHMMIREPSGNRLEFIHRPARP